MLIDAARAIIAKRFKQGFHHVGAALRTKSGRVFSALHLEATVGRVAVCAEAIAIGMAASAGESGFEEIVAVNRNGEVVSPCGMCRELIADHAPECRVIVPTPEGPKVVSVGDLIPHKYTKYPPK